MLLTLLETFIIEVYINLLLIQPPCAKWVYQTHFLKLLFVTVPFNPFGATPNPQLPQKPAGTASDCTLILSVSSHLLPRHKLTASLLKLILLFIFPYLFQIVSYLQESFSPFSHNTCLFYRSDSNLQMHKLNDHYYYCSLGVTVLLWPCVRWVLSRETAERNDYEQTQEQNRLGSNLGSAPYC